MTPPPRRPDDPRPPPAGEPDPLDDLPVAEVVGRPAPDPRLDEPLVADLVDAGPGPDLVLETAEPVPPAGRPRAVPVMDPPKSAADRRDPPPWPKLPDPADNETSARPRVFAACAVIGCFGLALLVAVGLVAFGVVVLLGHFGDRFARRSDDAAPAWPRPGPVTRTAVAERTTIQLGGAFDAVGRGAGGRYLFLRVPAQKRLAVFDPVAGEVVRSVQLPGPDALFAAGAAKLWVFDPKARTVERTDLVTWAGDGPLPVPDDLRAADAMAAGAGSDGPVFLAAAGPAGADVWRLDGPRLGLVTRTRLPFLKGGGPARARASADGRVLAVSTLAGVGVVRPEGDAGQPLGGLLTDRPTLGTPGPDGQFVYTPRGAYNLAGQSSRPRGNPIFYTLPTAQGGGLFVSLTADADGRLAGPPRVHLADAPLAVAATLPGVTVPRGLRADAAGDVPPIDRVHLWPAAGLAAVLPPKNDTIELTPVDVAARLRAGDAAGYLVIGSDPPTTAARGQRWTYRPEVWAREGTPRVEVVPPPGVDMRVEDGEVGWLPGPTAVPVEVTVRATDADGRTAEQRFRVVVTDP